MPKAKQWKMPKWMEPYRACIVNTGGNKIEDMMNGNADPLINLPLSTLQCAVKSQVRMLEVLHDGGALPAPDAANLLVTIRRMRDALHGIAEGAAMVAGSRQLSYKLRPGMAAIAEAARRGLGA